MSAILHSDPPDLSQSKRPVPLAADRLVRHCLEKSSSERFQSARDLAFNLETLSTFSSHGTMSGVANPANPSVPRTAAQAGMTPTSATVVPTSNIPAPTGNVWQLSPTFSLYPSKTSGWQLGKFTFVSGNYESDERVYNFYVDPYVRR